MTMTIWQGALTSVTVVLGTMCTSTWGISFIRNTG